MVSHTHRRGFTLIETTVALGLIALLCALIVPAIQSQREQARRSQCKDRLKQIGLALHNYHDTFITTFPPGFIVGANGVYHGWSWSVFIVPYLEDNPFYNSIQFSAGLQTEYSKPGLHPQLPAFRCPADVGGAVVPSVSMVTTNVADWTVTPGDTDVKDTFARSNYFGNAGFLREYAGGIKLEDPGTSASPDANLNQGSLGTAATKYSRYHRYLDQRNCGGVFGQNSKIGIRDMTDGTSNTLLVGERYTPRRSTTGQSVIGDGGWLGVPDPTTAAGLAMSLGDTSIDIKHNINGRPTTGFGSYHSGDANSGGVNVLLADGSVRFVGAKIDTYMYRGLSTIDDGLPKSCGF